MNSTDTYNKKITKGDETVKLSKSLSWLLRHGAPQEKVTVYPGGYVNVVEILKLHKFKKFTESDIRSVVENNDKQRFSLKQDDKSEKLQIRANQGHTFPVDEAELLEVIVDPSDYPTVIHGTYRRNWNSIQEKGLSRMGRNHIHFAPGEPGTEGVISGMRSSVDLYIYINIQKALKDGIKFFRSNNNVILTPGDSKGYLQTKYFCKVKDIAKNEYILG